MNLALFALVQLAAAHYAPPADPAVVVRPAAESDTIPQITLVEALSAAAQLDPNYVAALGGIGNALWVRRSAYAVFVLPSVSISSSLTKASEEFFNLGTGGLTDQIVDARVEARYNLFRGGAKYFEMKRARAEMESAEATEVQARFNTALLTESDFYNVIAERELVRVAAERVRRADEQLAVARARVVSGAAVQTDSLQLLLELTRARVDLLRQRASLRVAQVQLGRRVGIAGPVDAVALDTLPALELPISEDSAVVEALAQGPEYRIAIAEERASDAAAKAAYGTYLPQIDLFASWQGFDDGFFPDATSRTVWGFQIRLPLWNDGQREIALSRAKANRDVARAVRRDAELAVRRDAIEAYQAYVTARASAELAQQAVIVAQENLDVQETRYRAGATTILDLLSAQVSLSEAEAGLVQARYAARLALAGLEAILGRRLFTDRGY
ncbi:MAG: TolC family protein [Gemmatimonadota bacterium]|nr:MAG: TolC family protein [Gemmatimonadota bacterium]